MAFLDPKPRLRKTASPYFRLNFIDSDKLPGGKVEETQNFENSKREKFNGGIPQSIASRLSEIRYTNERDKGDRLDLIFRSVPVSEMDTNFFAKAVGYELYLGWWDWLTTVRNSARVFSGVVVSNSFDYDELGVNITLTLEHKGLSKARIPIPLDIFSRAATTVRPSRGRVRETRPVVRSVKSALREMAKFLGVRLAWAVEEPDTKLYLEDDIISKKDAPPWALPLFKTKADSKGNLVKIRMTASIFLTDLAKAYGQVWYVHSNVLYFGTSERSSRAKVRKVFRYREQGGLKNILNPTNEDTFKTFKPVKLRSTGTKSKSLGIDETTKELHFSEAKIEDVSGIPDHLRVWDQKDQLTLEESVARKQLKAIKKLQDRKIKSQGENKKAIEMEKQNDVEAGRVMTTTANSKDDDKAQLSGKSAKAKEEMMGILVTGAKGDPFFGVWDKFYISGASNLQGHNGSYLTVKTVHVLTREEGYTMDITGTKPQPLRTKEFNKLQDDLLKASEEKSASDKRIDLRQRRNNEVISNEEAATKSGYAQSPPAVR